MSLTTGTLLTRAYGSHAPNVNPTPIPVSCAGWPWIVSWRWVKKGCCREFRTSVSIGSGSAFGSRSKSAHGTISCKATSAFSTDTRWMPRYLGFPGMDLSQQIRLAFKRPMSGSAKPSMLGTDCFTATNGHDLRVHSAFAVSGQSSIWRFAAEAWQRPKTRFDGSLPIVTIWGCSPKRLHRLLAPRWVTSPRHLLMLG